MNCTSYINILVCLLLFNIITYAQKNNDLGAKQKRQIEIFDTEDGLSQGMIFDLLQDRDGFIWIATKDGLNRYDGYEFKVFTNNPNDPWSISGNQIDKLFEDSQGRIWASVSNGGLNIYDKTTNRFHRIIHNPKSPLGLSGSSILDIEEDTSGYFIVNVDQKEINMFRLEEQFFSNQKEPQVIRVPLPTEEISRYDSLNSESFRFAKLNGIFKDDKGRILIGGVRTTYQLDIQKAEVTPLIKGYRFSYKNTCSKGSTWTITNGTNLVKWDGEKITEYPTVIPDARETFLNIGMINDSIIFGNTHSSIHTINMKQMEREYQKEIKNPYYFEWKRVVHKNDLQHELKLWLSDNSGGIWIGTNGYGLYKIQSDKSIFNHNLESVSIRRIYPIDNHIYLKNHEDLLLSPDSSTVKGWNLPISPWTSGLGGELIQSSAGEVWYRGAGHIKDGVKIYYGNRTEEEFFYLRKYSSDGEDYNEYYYSWHHVDMQPIVESSDGSIWMAGYNNVLSHIDKSSGAYTSYNFKSGNIINTPLNEQRAYASEISTALYEDKNGVLWIGSESGFTRFSNARNRAEFPRMKKFENIPGDQTSLSYNHVTCFLDDPKYPDQYLWVCTKGGGLNRLDKKKNSFIKLTKENGLPDNVIYGILADDNGNLWGSTNKGLFCMTQSGESNNESEIKYQFRNFNKSEGLQDNEFNTGAFSKLPDGRLAFGGINGYNTFDPKAVLTKAFEPPIHITELSINNKIILPNDDSGILASTIDNTKKITLTYSDNIINLKFSSLDFSAPDWNMYRYQLEGAGDTWVEAGNNRSATFINLKPKEYIFKVQGSNSQGVWNDHTAELIINILPPWWKTWWAYLFYVSVFGAGIWSYFQFSLKRSRLKQQLQFEKRETERVKDLDALKTQLYMNMTHEFRTPLTIILGMVHQIEDNPKKHLKSGLKMIGRNGQNLLNLVNKMLNLSKLESGKMTLNLVHGDIVKFLRNIVESFHSYAVNKEIQLHFLPEIDILMMDFDAEKLQQIISNLISNAFKFTPQDGHIYFNIKQKGESLIIGVKDTGRGIPADNLVKIFDRFYQIDNTTTRQYDGSGIGLALSKELVSLMEGTIIAQSPPTGLKKGAEFIVQLPIRKLAHIQASEIGKTKIKKPITSQVPDNEIDKIESQTHTTTIIDNSADHLSNIQSRQLILLVEDNEDVAAYVSSCLPDHYQLVIAENGQEGLDLSAELIPDLIISDVMMPIMDGFEFCRRLKSDKLTQHIPVIILTARADLDSKLEGLEIGANAYLPKPFEKQELLLTIKNMFGLREKLRNHYQQIGGIQEKNNDAIKVEKLEDTFVIDVRAFIEENLSDFNLDVDQIAKKMHLSQSQLRRKLDALIGLSPNRFIRFIRLKKAKELLKDSELTITVVSYECGFGDPSYFTRVFKKEFGQSPNEWRSTS